MKTILQVNTSILSNEGQSTRLANEFVAQLGANEVILRDLSAEPVPHLDAERFGAFIAPKEKRSERQNHVARAGVYLDTPRDTQTGYVRDFLGITDVEFVYAEGLAISEASKTASLARARESLQVLVPALA